MPYLYEVDSILSQLYQNGSINESNFPIFSTASFPILAKDSLKETARKFSFFISAKYDFQKRTWNSGGLEINKDYWAERNADEQMYPILDDRLLLVENNYQWTRTDHWGAVNCHDSLHSSFKVNNDWFQFD